MPSADKQRPAYLAEWPQTYQWITGFLEDKTTPRKIAEWCGWANNRLKAGWTRESIEKRIRAAWHTHTLMHDQKELDKDLLETLHEVYKMADAGWTPAKCAVVYRSLAKIHPGREWLQDWAERWEAAGDDWQAVVIP